MFTCLESLSLWDERLRLQVGGDDTRVHDDGGIAPWANLRDAMPA